MEVRPGKASLRNDIELLAVVLFWAFNLVVLKFGLREVEPLAYNAVRLASASLVLLVLTAVRERSLSVRREDVGRVLLLGLLGHTLYQICFIEGIARTTASSVALLFGSVPVVVGLMSRLAGHERISFMAATGALLGFFGIYLIVGEGGPASGQSAGTGLVGNLWIVGCVLCWSAYTVLARRLLRRYSPLRLTALSLSFGTVLFVPVALPSVLRQSWISVSTITWVGLVYSFLFALVICYILWYRSVKKVGNLRTAVYSNLVPVFGTLFAVWLLDERLTSGLGLGAACILAGIVLTRLRRARG